MRPENHPWNKHLAGLMNMSATLTHSKLEREKSEPALRNVGLKLLKLADSETGQANAAALTVSGKVLACKNGCAFCCMQPFAITLPELAVLVEAVHAKYDDKEVDAIAEGFAEQKGALKGTSLHRKMCPLNKAGSCTVYEARPSACRAFASVNVDLCQQKFEGQQESIAIEGPPGWIVAHAFREGILKGLQKSGSHARMLSGAVLSVALKDRESIQHALEGSDKFDEFDEFTPAPV